MLMRLEDRVVPSATLLAETTAVDMNNEGIIASIRSTIGSFDNKGNLLSSVFTADNDGDGTVDSIRSITNSFDKHDNGLRNELPL